MTRWHPARIALAAIALGTLQRLASAATFGLGIDESYAVAVARPFSLSYFDHPPLVFWLAGGMTALTGSAAPFVVRLPFIALFAVTSWFLWRLGARLLGEWPGVLAVLLLNVSGVFAFSTGGWVLPDGPLLCALAGSALAASHAMFHDDGAPRDPAGTAGWWLLAGLGAAVAAMAKYHAIFLPIGLVVFLITSAPHRRHLASPGPWLAATVAGLGALPTLLWNASHDWASFRFQGGRAAPGDGVAHVGALLENLGGQMAWVFPWLWLPLAWALLRAWNAGRRAHASWFLACLASGPVVVFTLVTLGGDRGLPHWPAPGWFFAWPLLGALVAPRLVDGRALPRRWLATSVVLYAALAALVTTHAATGWVARAIPSAFAAGDPAFDLVRWDGAVAEIRRRGWDRDATLWATIHWMEGGKLGAALASSGEPVLAFTDDPRHFRFAMDREAAVGEPVLVVHRAGWGESVPTRLEGLAERVELLGTVPVMRGATTAFELEVWRVGRLLRVPLLRGDQGLAARPLPGG